MFNVYISRPGAAATEREYVDTLNVFRMGEGAAGSQAVHAVLRRVLAGTRGHPSRRCAAGEHRGDVRGHDGTAPTGGAAAGLRPPITLAEGTQIGAASN